MPLITLKGHSADVNRPVDVSHIQMERQLLVIQALRRGGVQHAKHGVAAPTEQIHDQTAGESCGHGVNN